MSTEKERSAWANALAAVIVLSLFCWLCHMLYSNLIPGSNWNGVIKYRGLLVRGWLVTLAISMAALLLSVALGILLVIGMRSGLRAISASCRLYIEIVRGTPLLVQIYIGFYIIANELHLGDRYVAGGLVLALFSSAYLAEIFRGGIESVGGSQIQAARAVGFDTLQTYRYIVIPQAIRRVSPATAGELVSLVKNSSLLSVIAVGEFTKAAENINSKTFGTFEAYIPIAIGYLILTVPISLAARQFEKKYRYET